MKWYKSLCLACSFALLIPAISFAQPGPGPRGGGPGGPGGPGSGPVAGPRPGGPGPGPGASARPGDRRDGPGPGPAVAPRPGNPGPGPAVAPRPGGPRPGPMAGPRPAPAPRPMVSARGPMVAPPPPPPVFAPRPGFEPRYRGMHPGDFTIYLNHVDRIVYRADRIDYILNGRGNYWYTSLQVRQILDHLTYESDMLRVACDLYPRVVDTENWDLVFDAFASRSSRVKLASCSR